MTDSAKIDSTPSNGHIFDREVRVTFHVRDIPDEGISEARWRETESDSATYAGLEMALIRAALALFRVYHPRTFTCDFTIRDGHGVLITSNHVITRNDNPVLALQSDDEEDHGGRGQPRGDGE